MPAGSDGCTVHDLGISQELLMRSTVLQEVMLCQLGICYWNSSDCPLQITRNQVTRCHWVKVANILNDWSAVIFKGIPRILRLFDQRRQRHHVHSEHWEPFNQWHSTTPPVLTNTAVRTWDNGVISQKTCKSSDVQYFWHLLRLQCQFHKWLGLP